MSLLSGLTINAPGVYVFPTTAGTRPAEFQPFKSTYMVGASSTGSKNVPVRVSSGTDFTNVFGTSESKPSVDLYFANNPNGTLYFVNTAIAPRYEVTYASIAAGAYTVVINGTTISVTATISDTASTLAANVIDAINTHTVISKEVLASNSGTGKVLIRNKNPLIPLTCTVTGTGATVANAAPNSPDVTDYVYCTRNAFDPDLEAGFVIAPQAFKTFGSSSRQSVALALEELASSNRYQWVALIDCGNNTDITSISRAITEAGTLSSPQGHSAYYFPYLVDLNDVIVPPSAGIAGLAIRRYAEQTFAEPPAGFLYTIKGVKDLTYQATWTEQDAANPKSVNVILKKPNKGIVCFGARSLSTDKLFKFVSTRVILNIVINTLRRSFDNELFSSIGGQGQLLFDIQRKATAILDAFWRAGLLYGTTPQDAFSVIADSSVQLSSLLEEGITNMFVWVVPATILERLNISVRRVAIGELQVTVTSDLNVISDQVTEETNADNTDTNA